MWEENLRKFEKEGREVHKGFAAHETRRCETPLCMTEERDRYLGIPEVTVCIIPIQLQCGADKYLIDGYITMQKAEQQFKYRPISTSPVARRQCKREPTLRTRKCQNNDGRTTLIC